MIDDTLKTCGPIEAWEADGQGLRAFHDRGVARVDAVATDILRVRFTPSGEFAPRRSWDPVTLSSAENLKVSEAGESLKLETGAIRALLDRGTGALAFFTADDLPFAQDLGGPGWRDVDVGETALKQTPETELPPGPARTGLFLDKLMAPDEGYFGFGQRTGRIDRRHRRLTNWNVDRSSPGHCRGNDNMYQSHPVLLAVRPGLAWGLYLHSTWYSAFDAGAAKEQVLTLFTLGGELDYYLLGGPTPAAVVEQLTRLTGRPALPPLWAMGFHQSRWSYGSDEEVQALARGFRERAIPLDAIHFDIDYMDGFRVFTWNEERFPDPAQTVRGLHERGIRAVAIVDPGVKKDLGRGYEVAEQGAAGDHFVREPNGALFSGHVWPGESLLPDFFRTDTRRWWGDLHAGLLATGIDGIWCDMNEPSIGDRPFSTLSARDKPIPLSALQGDVTERALHAETHNLYGQLMARATTEGQERLRPEQRPWTLTRSGHVGVQRWAASWMGDNSAWWEHLEMSLPQLASMGLCGSPHVGVDIGGFYHNCFGELFARWMELGAFYPFMRSHAHKDSRPQEPWAFGPEVEAIATAAIELRYRLLPYLYTLAHRAYRTGEPILRPLLYDFPEQTDLHQIEDQVMIGPMVMVAPVYQPGVRRRLVELPPGPWYDFWSGAQVGPGPLVQPAPLGRVPILVRGGSILTLGNVRQSTAEPLIGLTLSVYPGAPGRWTLIEDDGETLAYRDGRIAETDMEVTSSAGGVCVCIGDRRGRFAPYPRNLTLRLHLPDRPEAVLINRQETRDWRWDAERLALELGWDDDGKARVIATRK